MSDPDWLSVFDKVDAWTQKLAYAAGALQPRFRSLVLPAPVSIYANPETERFAVFGDYPAIAKQAAISAIGSELVDEAPIREESLRNSPWVKLASSNALHRIGEVLNFFPGQYFGGIPNHPSPLAAMLTSGALGAGLGWGAGHLANSLLPEGYGGNLPRSGAVIGGLLGASPGAAWGLANKLDDRPFNDPSIFSHTSGDYPEAANGTNSHFLSGRDASTLEKAINAAMRDLSNPATAGQLPKTTNQLGSFFQKRSAWPPEDPSAVNIDALGRVLWETGAPADVAAAALGAVHVAKKFPDPEAKPGYVTGHQLGQLSLRAAGDYVSGYLAGKVINSVIGTPLSAPAFGGGAIALDVLTSVLPKLFGQ